MRLQEKNWKELFRLSSLVETFAEPLKECEFAPLLITYARGLANFTIGDVEGATEQFSKLPRRDRLLDINGLSLSIPDEVPLTAEKLKRRAIIVTALPVEYLAVRTHLKELREDVHPGGTVYERGKFIANGKEWEVGIAEIEAGNARAAAAAERAIAYFQPHILLFVGIAGGIKDVTIGDVVVGTKVYGYEAGKVGDEDQFFTRPDLGQSSYALVQRAKAEARKEEWLQRLSSSSQQPHVFVALIAAGEKVMVGVELGITPQPSKSET